MHAASQATRLGMRQSDNAAAVAASTNATMLGLGLMGTGQSGVFREMGPSGNLAAQSWNASLAVLGAGEQRQRASQNPAPRRYQQPKSAKSEGERNADQILERYTRGR